MNKRRTALLGVFGALTLIACLLAWPEASEQETLEQAAVPSEPRSSAPAPVSRAAPNTTVREAAGDETEAWAAFDAEFEEMVATDLKCPVLGVPQGTRGVLQVGIERFVVDVYRPELAMAQLSFHLDPGSGVLSLEGYAPLTVHWDKEGDRFLCEASRPVSSADPFGVSGVVTDVEGHPVHGAKVSACGGRSETEEDGAFFLIRRFNGACELRVQAAETSAVLVVPPAEEDLDLGEITLPDEPAGIGADFSLAVLAFQSGRGGEGLQVLQVLPGSPAEQAGLKAMDVVVSVNGALTEGTHPAQFFERPAGETLLLGLADGRELSVTMEGLRGILERAGQDPGLVAETLVDRGLGGQYALGQAR